MSITINNADDIAKMRIAGKLASEVLDYISPFVVHGVTTDTLDKLCHDYIVNVQQAIPAPLNYAPDGHTPTLNRFAPQSTIKFAMVCLAIRYLKMATP